MLLVAAQVPLNRSLILLFLTCSTLLLLIGKVGQRVWARRRRGEALALVVGGGAQEMQAVAEQSHLRGRQVETIATSDGGSLRERLRQGGVDEVVVAGALPTDQLMASAGSGLCADHGGPLSSERRDP